MYGPLCVYLDMKNKGKTMKKKHYLTTEQQLAVNAQVDFWNAIDTLKENIKKDYAKWSTWEEGIERFNDTVRMKIGKKYTKIICKNSVWGFIANGDGVLKGIPYFKGDVFKAAGWAAPAKHVRGSIFDTNTDWFAWTGPNYL